MSVIAIQDLWCHEVRRASIGLHMMSGVLGEAEVDETDLTIFSKHNVLWLDVTVSYTEGVAMLQRIKTLADDITCFFLGVRLSLLDVIIVRIEKFSARA